MKNIKKISQKTIVWLMIGLQLAPVSAIAQATEELFYFTQEYDFPVLNIDPINEHNKTSVTYLDALTLDSKGMILSNSCSTVTFGSKGVVEPNWNLTQSNGYFCDAAKDIVLEVEDDEHAFISGDIDYTGSPESITINSSYGFVLDGANFKGDIDIFLNTPGPLYIGKNGVTAQGNIYINAGTLLIEGPLVAKGNVHTNLKGYSSIDQTPYAFIGQGDGHIQGQTIKVNVTEKDYGIRVSQSITDPIEEGWKSSSGTIEFSAWAPIEVDSSLHARDGIIIESKSNNVILQGCFLRSNSIKLAAKEQITAMGIVGFGFDHFDISSEQFNLVSSILFCENQFDIRSRTIHAHSNSQIHSSDSLNISAKMLQLFNSSMLAQGDLKLGIDEQIESYLSSIQGRTVDGIVNDILILGAKDLSQEKPKSIGHLHAQENLDLEVHGLTSLYGGSISSGGPLKLETFDLTLEESKEINSPDLDKEQSIINGQSLDIKVHNKTNNQGEISSTNDLALHSEGEVINQGDIKALESLSISGPISLFNAKGGVIASGDQLGINLSATDSTLNNRGLIHSTNGTITSHKIENSGTIKIGHLSLSGQKFANSGELFYGTINVDLEQYWNSAIVRGHSPINIEKIGSFIQTPAGLTDAPSCAIGSAQYSDFQGKWYLPKGGLNVQGHSPRINLQTENPFEQQDTFSHSQLAVIADDSGSIDIDLGTQPVHLERLYTASEQGEVTFKGDDVTVDKHLRELVNAQAQDLPYFNADTVNLEGNIKLNEGFSTKDVAQLNNKANLKAPSIYLNDENLILNHEGTLNSDYIGMDIRRVEGSGTMTSSSNKDSDIHRQLQVKTSESTSIGTVSQFDEANIQGETGVSIKSGITEVPNLKVFSKDSVHTGNISADNFIVSGSSVTTGKVDAKNGLIVAPKINAQGINISNNLDLLDPHLGDVDLSQILPLAINDSGKRLDFDTRTLPVEFHVGGNLTLNAQSFYSNRDLHLGGLRTRLHGGDFINDQSRLEVDSNMLVQGDKKFHNTGHIKVNDYLGVETGEAVNEKLWNDLKYMHTLVVGHNAHQEGKANTGIIECGSTNLHANADSFTNKGGATIQITKADQNSFIYGKKGVHNEAHLQGNDQYINSHYIEETRINGPFGISGTTRKSRIDNSYMRQNLIEIPSSINSMHDVTLVSDEGPLLNFGSDITSQGNLNLLGNQQVYSGATADSTFNAKREMNYYAPERNFSPIYHPPIVSAKNNINAQSENGGIHLAGSDFIAGGDIDLTARKSVQVEAFANLNGCGKGGNKGACGHRIDIGKGPAALDVTAETLQSQYNLNSDNTGQGFDYSRGGHVISGGKLTIEATDGNVECTACTLASEEDMDIFAGSDILFLGKMGSYVDAEHQGRKKGYVRYAITGRSAEAYSKKGINMHAEGDIHMQGTTLGSAGDMNLKGTNIWLEPMSETVTHEEWKKKRRFIKRVKTVSTQEDIEFLPVLIFEGDKISLEAHDELKARGTKVSDDVNEVNATAPKVTVEGITYTLVFETKTTTKGLSFGKFVDRLIGNTAGFDGHLFSDTRLDDLKRAFDIKSGTDLKPISNALVSAADMIDDIHSRMDEDHGAAAATVESIANELDIRILDSVPVPNRLGFFNQDVVSKNTIQRTYASEFAPKKFNIQAKHVSLNGDVQTGKETEVNIKAHTLETNPHEESFTTSTKSKTKSTGIKFDKESVKLDASIQKFRSNSKESVFRVPNIHTNKNVFIDIASDAILNGIVLNSPNYDIAIGGNLHASSVMNYCSIDEETTGFDVGLRIGSDFIYPTAGAHWSKTKGHTNQYAPNGIFSSPNGTLTVNGTTTFSNFMLEGAGSFKTKKVSVDDKIETHEKKTESYSLSLGFGNILNYGKDLLEGFSGMFSPSIETESGVGYARSTVSSDIKIDSYEPLENLNRDFSKMRSPLDVKTKTYSVGIPLRSAQSWKNTANNARAVYNGIKKDFKTFFAHAKRAVAQTPRVQEQLKIQEKLHSDLWEGIDKNPDLTDEEKITTYQEFVKNFYDPETGELIAIYGAKREAMGDQTIEEAPIEEILVFLGTPQYTIQTSNDGSIKFDPITTHAQKITHTFNELGISPDSDFSEVAQTLTVEDESKIKQLASNILGATAKGFIKYWNNPRVQGTLIMVEGVAEVALGTSLMLAPTGQILGALLLAHGSSTFQKGGQTFIQDEIVEDSVFSSAIAAMGVEEETARNIDTALGMAGLVGGTRKSVKLAADDLGTIARTNRQLIPIQGGEKYFVKIDGNKVHVSEAIGGLKPAVQEQLLGMTFPKRALVPGGGLVGHELRGGHAIARHVGKSIEYLRARAQRARPRADGSPRHFSTFENLEKAELFISKTIKNNKKNIKNWLKTNDSKFELQMRFDTPVGQSIDSVNLSLHDSYEAFVVLVKDESFSSGYRILTAFPTL